VRYVKTEQSSTGYQLVAGAAQQTTVERTYDDWLPALNITAEVTPDVLLRFGAAKVMTRPNLGSLTPGGSLSTVGVFSVSSGNPNLDPIRATTYDLSAEWYFAKDALLSVGLFYKDIDSYIQTSRISQPFSASGLPLALLDGLGVSPNDTFLFSQPVNTQGGPLKGIEVSYQQPFSFLPGVLRRTGAIFNVTVVDSKIDYISARSPTGFVQNDLVGLSKNAFNATLYYEDERFSARVSGAYRDKYLTAVPSGTSTNDVDGVRETFTVDASASYAINKRLKVTFEGLNLTDAFNDQYTDSRRDSVYVYSHTGRQYNFGLRYSF
jgi:TonB-dependent receptor